MLHPTSYSLALLILLLVHPSSPFLLRPLRSRQRSLPQSQLLCPPSLPIPTPSLLASTFQPPSNSTSSTFPSPSAFTASSLQTLSGSDLNVSPGFPPERHKYSVLPTSFVDMFRGSGGEGKKPSSHSFADPNVPLAHQDLAPKTTRVPRQATSPATAAPPS